jgi:tRNA nucleotidyltransferase (CCA-adding enzyme)
VIHPVLIWDEWIEKKFGSLDELESAFNWGIRFDQGMRSIRCELAYTLWLMRLESVEARHVLKRLRVSTELGKTVLAASGLWHEREELARASAGKFVSRLEYVPALSRYALYIAASNVDLKHQLQMYLSEWQNIKPTIDGEYLKHRGLPPGPAYRQILSSLRNAWLDGKIKTRKEEAEMVECLLQKYLHDDHQD